MIRWQFVIVLAISLVWPWLPLDHGGLPGIAFFVLTLLTVLIGIELAGEGKRRDHAR